MTLRCIFGEKGEKMIPNKMRRVNLKIDEELKHQVRTEALAEKVSMQDWITQLIIDALEKKKVST